MVLIQSYTTMCGDPNPSVMLCVCQHHPHTFRGRFRSLQDVAIAQLHPHVQSLLPRLFRSQNDPNTRVKEVYSVLSGCLLYATPATTQLSVRHQHTRTLHVHHIT